MKNLFSKSSSLFWLFYGSKINMILVWENVSNMAWIILFPYLVVHNRRTHLQFNMQWSKYKQTKNYNCKIENINNYIQIIVTLKENEKRKNKNTSKLRNVNE